MKNKEHYWYLFTTIECPVCGNGDKYKERKYSKRPKNKKDRYIYKQEYDRCMESLFL